LSKDLAELSVVQHARLVDVDLATTATTEWARTKPRRERRVARDVGGRDIASADVVVMARSGRLLRALTHGRPPVRHTKPERV
jgi:hypothetical protein